jgi:Na+-transporting methylmalonyl-CoA/oxaloacetate decarboxylase beta subunit
MSNRRRKKNTGAKIIQFLLILVILGLVIFIFKIAVWDSILKKKAVNYAVSNVIEQVAASSGVSVTSKEVEEVLNSMDPEDQETLNTIIEENVDQEAVSTITSYVSNGDMESAAEYVQENLSEENVEDLQQLYDKYLADEYGDIDIQQYAK